ncbi:hypothetical protein ACTM9K_13635 [Bariatricus sp. HCP3S3_E12]|uniref:hypothetical protein n=1 Tax=Bariatricus sp. HCP3S3_E12 TaxID=3438906 RepID=UPI003F8899DB
MYFERDVEKKKIPSWSVKDGIPAFTLPEYSPIGIPVLKTNYFITGSIGMGKTDYVKKVVKYRIEEQPDLRLAVLQIKPHDFDELVGDKGLFISQNPNDYPIKRLFHWNAMREFRAAGEEKYMESIQEFSSLAAFEFHMSAGANLYFVDTAEETVNRYFLSLLHSTTENLSNDKTFGFLENAEPEKILRMIGNYPFNHNFLKTNFDFDPESKSPYTLSKRGHDIFIFVSKIVRVIRGTFREPGEDTIWDFLHSGKQDVSRICICHEEGSKSSYIMEQYFLKRITTLMLGSETSISGDLLMVLDEVDKTRVKNFPLSTLAELGRDVSGKRTQLILSTQSFESLYAVAEDGNEHDIRSLLAAFPVSVSFNPGMDATTRDILKAAFGNHLIQKITTPISRYDSPRVEVTEKPFVNEYEFSSLSTGQCYIKVKSERPYRVQIRE